MRVRYVKDHGKYAKGEVREVLPGVAERLIGQGIAVLDVEKAKPQGRVPGSRKRIRAGEAGSHEPERPVGG